MTEWVIKFGNRYLTGFGRHEEMTVNIDVAATYRDKEAAVREADRVNGLRLGNNRAEVEPLPERQRRSPRMEYGSTRIKGGSSDE